MKKLLLGALLLLSILSFGQDRAVPQKKLFMSQFNIWLSTTNGYDYDESKEKWINRKNYIDFEKEGFIDICEKYNKTSTEAKSRTNQNFNEIGIIKIKYDNVDYIGITFKKVVGKYRYAAIQEDWWTDVQPNIVIYTMDEIEKLKSSDNDLVLKSFINVNDGGSNYQYDTTVNYKNCYENLNYSFKENYIQKQYEYDYTEMYFKKTTSNNKKVVRFLLPQSLYPEDSRMSNYNNDKKIDFEKHYFEISIEDFNRLLTLIK